MPETDDVDNRTLDLPLHMRNRLFACQEHALQVDVVDPVPALFGGLDGTADLDDTDIIVQHIDAAEGGDTTADHGRDIVGTRHVGGDGLTDAAFPTDDPLGLERRVAVDVHGENLCPFSGEEHRRRLAVAPARAARARAGNERHFVLEPIGHTFLLRQVSEV